MSLDPQERLEALRREVEAERPATPAPPPAVPAPAPDAVAPVPATPSTGTTPPAPAPMPVAPPPTSPPPTVPTPVAPPPDPTLERASTSSDPAPPSDGSPAGLLARLAGGLIDIDLHDLIADRSLSSWLGIGLLVLGGYLVLSWFVPAVSFIGSLALLAAGVALLYVHLVRHGPPWTLYAGAALTGMGAARVVGAILPGEWHGTTAIGVGLAFLAIGYLRNTQAGGYGWQGVAGGAALALGLVQLVLGWLPGGPGLFDLLSPAVLVGLGVILVVGTRWLGGRRPPAPNA